MNDIRTACPVIAFMVQQATAQPGVESDFLRAVERGDIHACCDLDPLPTSTAKLAKPAPGLRPAAQARFTDPGYGEWARCNLR
jgi:hypothetical protein